MLDLNMISNFGSIDDSSGHLTSSNYETMN